MSGRLGAFVAPVAILLVTWWAFSGWKDPRARGRALYLLIPGAGQALVLGVLSHGEARFLFFPLALLMIGGSIGGFRIAASWKSDVARAVQATLVVLLIGSLAASAAFVRRSVDSRADATLVVTEAARLMSAGSPGTCGAMTSYLPQVTYYSACDTIPFRTHLEPEEALSRLAGDDRFVLMVEEGKRQPTGPDLAGILDLTTGQAVRIESERSYADVYEFAPSS